ncbi:MFS transporter permease [Leifsonia sp. Root227]|uniref:MFS transporter n=1 Tax=Leifsonia sp. Root227 TaxID=1736496 RepID=UPI0006FA938E|nr:MFS transporter [Leifsonia sp. Root227]KRC46706.1 MFS transporter permease [Leifsonia sp. Root227]
MSQTTPTSTRSRRELHAWRNAVFVIFILSGLAMASWVARIPGVRDGLGLGKDPSAVGLLILGLSAGAIVGLVAASPLLVRFGPHKGMVGGLFIVSAGMMLIGVGASIAHSVPLVAIGLILLGFGNGMVDVMMNVEGTAVEREIGKTLMPLMHACFSLGTVIGAGFGAAAAALGIDVSWHLIVTAVVIAVAIVIAVRFVPREAELGDEVANTPAVPFRQRMRENLAVWADWRLILIGVVMLGMAFGEGSANDWISLAVVDGHGQSNSTGALVFGFFVAAMTLGRVLGGPLVDRIGRVLAIRITGGLGAAGLLIFILGGPLWVVIIGTVLWGFGVSLGFPLGMSAASEGAANPAARVSAVAIIGYCAFLVGPPVIGFLGKEFGLLNALYLVLVLLIAAFAAAGAVRPVAKPAPAASPASPASEPAA